MKNDYFGYEYQRNQLADQFGEMYNPDRTNQGYNDLWSTYAGIGDFQSSLKNDLMSPEEMSQMMLNYNRTAAPGIAQNRARASAEAGGRLGSRSGATSRAVYNKVDVPAQFAENEFATNLYNLNIQSRDSRQRQAELNEMNARMFGAQGQSGLWGGMMNQGQAYAQMFNQLGLGELGLQAARAGNPDSGFGWEDIVDIGTSSIPLFA